MWMLDHFAGKTGGGWWGDELPWEQWAISSGQSGERPSPRHTSGTDPFHSSHSSPHIDGISFWSITECTVMLPPTPPPRLHWERLH